MNGSVVTDFNYDVDFDRDAISVDGKPLKSRDYQYLILHKPKDVLTTCDDPGGRRTVMDILPPEYKHLKPVGRLDRQSEGLLILTNDGDFSHKLMHPSKQIWKTYKGTCGGRLQDQDRQKLEQGVELKDGITLPSKVEIKSIEEDKSTFLISIREGRNRQIRRMCSQLGYPVIRLVRVAIGRLQLKPMAPGQFKFLSKDQIEELCGIRRENDSF